MKRSAILLIGVVITLSMPRPLTAAPAAAVVINEVQTRGAAGATDEFVELYNRSSAPVNIGGWLLKRSSSTALVTTLAAVPAGVALSPDQSYVFGGPAFVGARDQSYNTPVADDGGVAIATQDHAIVDAIGWSATSAFLERRPAPVAAAGQSVQRVPEGDDTDDNAADFEVAAPTPMPTTAARGGRLHTLTPRRVLDTRVSGGPLGSAETRRLVVAGSHGIPSTGVSAVVMNVTVTEPTHAGHLTVYPNGAPRPVASNLNFAGGQTVPNLVTVRVGEGGAVSLFNSHGRTHVVVDVAGYVDLSPSGPDGRLQPITPARILDTRPGAGLAPRETRRLRVVGVAGVPATGVSAVVVNLTVTEPTASGYVTAFAASAPLPFASNVNFVAGQTVANRAVVGVSADGEIALYSSSGNPHLVVDIGGWFTASGTGRGSISTIQPLRLLDTRVSERVVPSPPTRVRVGGVLVPPGATAAVLNVTATAPNWSGWLAVWPSGTAQPHVSDLNFGSAQTVPNLVIAKLGPDGAINVATGGASAHVVIDVFGYVT